ncbi:MAG: hypothetical protein DRO89_01575 [Candidatus Altiarchaeales archaeon]|nr:MAG: hypothetical protein DRO89_01575 [Candidatus Altiarchaeales archaeon]
MLLRKIFIGFVSILLIILLIIDLCLIVFVKTINETLLNPEFIEMELDRLGFYSMIRERIIESVGDWGFAEVIDGVISEGWIREQTQTLLKNTFSYLRSETDMIDMNVSLVEIKDEILAQESFPPLIENELDKRFPDSVDLFDLLDLGKTGVLEQLRMFFGYFKIFLYLLVFIAITLILLIMLLLRDLKSTLLVISISSLLSGGISYGIYILFVDLISAQIRGPEFLPTDFLLVILEDVLSPVKDYGILLLIAGGLLLIIYLILRIVEEGRETGEEGTEQLLRERSKD